MTKTATPRAVVLIPYPQTPETARKWIRAHGLNQSELARQIGVDRLIVVDLLRGQLKGHRGEAHRAAIALGLKADPDTLDFAPCAEPERRTEERRRGAGRRKSNHS